MVMLQVVLSHVWQQTLPLFHKAKYPPFKADAVAKDVHPNAVR
jgi:hypothetical protein